MKHIYKCAACGYVFNTEDFAEKCPKCKSKTLIHKAGETRKQSCSCSGSCSSCSGCLHR